MSTMATSKELKNTPFAVAHPTDIIKDELKARGITIKDTPNGTIIVTE